MKKVLISLLAALMLAGCAATDEASSTATSEGAGETASSEAAVSEHKFAVMFGSGGLGDNGYNDEVYVGCEMASEQYNIPFDYVEPENVADYEIQLRSYAEAGEYDVIFAVSADQADAIKLVASEYPEQKFCMIDTAIEGYDNIHSITPSHPEQHFLSGVLAGLATQDERFAKSNPENILGFTIAMDSPVSRSQATGFIAGAKYVNPEVEILTNFIGDYNDPGKAKELAMVMYERGADIVSQNAGASGLGVFAAADEKDQYVIGTSLAMVDPDHSLSTSRKKVEQFIVQEIGLIMNGTWTPGVTEMGIAEGICDIDVEGLNTEIPEDVMAVIEDVKQKIANDELPMPKDIDEIDAWAAEYQY